jgi:hypothetical protein
MKTVHASSFRQQQQQQQQHSTSQTSKEEDTRTSPTVCLRSAEDASDDDQEASEPLDWDEISVPQLVRLLKEERERRLQLEEKLAALQRRYDEREDIWLSIIAARMGEKPGRYADD